jgi:hypothetical protein
MTCPRHKHCFYTGLEPGLCWLCHASTAKCGGEHGIAPLDNSWHVSRYATIRNPALYEGQPLNPKEASNGHTPRPQPQESLCMEVSS